MRKNRLRFVCLLATALAIAALLAACKPPTTGGNNPPDNPGTNTGADGFVTGTATVEDLSKELIGGINSALRPASTEHLGTASPYASIYNEWQMSINDKAAKLTVAIDYDHDKTLAKEPTIHWDKGTSTYIYTIPPQLLWGDISFHDFKWHKLYSDILPYIRQAVAAMQEKGEFSDTSLNDLIITGMNFGWEIPGTFDTGLEIKNIRIRMQQERRQK